MTDAATTSPEHALLSSLVEQNRKVIEENIAIRQSITELNTTIIDLKKKHEDEQKKNAHANTLMYSHFTEEFIHLRTSIDTMLQSIKNTSAGSSLPEFATPENILEFDQNLKYDAHLKTTLINKFKRQRNDDVRKFVTQNMQVIFHEETLAAQFSWAPTPNNISARDLVLIKILKDVTLEQIPQTTNSTIETHIKSFFNAAKDRLNKRNKRKAAGEKPNLNNTIQN